MKKEKIKNEQGRDELSGRTGIRFMTAAEIDAFLRDIPANDNGGPDAEDMALEAERETQALRHLVGVPDAGAALPDADRDGPGEFCRTDRGDPTELDFSSREGRGRTYGRGFLEAGPDFLLE
ncbi:hypothetical protein [Sneathiella chinensis]|uniref:Uncharacterized protein n=1 Tax=Sneathiella chinensis TaxID=349750 RepID=A0ABQ5U5Q9_9PROT|nr:hypothetical protein [Sneathiella chinensis]GLQ07500.1 hypothetical protein GCM10007924_27210 [Sneathiella chinensis]